MNIRAAINYHERKALELSRSRKSVAARTHSIRAEQFKTLRKLRQEVRSAGDRTESSNR